MSDAAAPRPRPDQTAPGHPRLMFLVLWLLGGMLLAFVLAPLIGLGATQSPASLARTAASAEIRQAIALSLEAAVVATTIAALAGVPLAYVLARGAFAGGGIVAALIDLPLAVPHTVAGIALLLVLGRQGVIGAAADAIAGLRFWGTLAGVVAAMLFVAAPYAVNAARIGFEAVDPRLEQVARTLGMGPWRTLLHVTLPLARRGIATGLTLTFARALSEFGAVAILAYYPMTAPVKIYELFLSVGLSEASGAAVLLLAVSLALFLLLRLLAPGRLVSVGGR